MSSAAAMVGSVLSTIAVLITTRDELVSPRKQRELAAGAGGPVFEQHAAAHGGRRPRGGLVLLEAIAAVSPRSAAAAA